MFTTPSALLVLSSFFFTSKTNATELSCAALLPHLTAIRINYTGQDTVIFMAQAQCTMCQQGISHRNSWLQGRDRYLGRVHLVARKEFMYNMVQKPF